MRGPSVYSISSIKTKSNATTGSIAAKSSAAITKPMNVSTESALQLFGCSVYFARSSTAAHFR